MAATTAGASVAATAGASGGAARGSGDLSAAELGETGLERELLKIGDVARLTQKTVRTLHFYEELEILHPHERTRGGFRLYSSESVSRVWLIEKLQTLGLSLPEIRDLLQDWKESETGSRAARKVLELMRARREQLEEEINRLKHLTTELDETIEYLHHCVTGCLKLTGPEQCTYCDHAADADHRPRMISGLYPY